MKNPKKPSSLKRLSADYLQPIWLKVKVFFYNLSSGDQAWGRMRLVLTLLVLFALLVISFLLLDVVRTLSGQVWEAFWNWILRERKPCSQEWAWYCPITEGIRTLFDFLNRVLFQWLWDEIVTQKRYRYLPALLLVITFVVMQGAKYIQDIYELKSYTSALHYLVASVFGILPYPWLRVAEGKTQVPKGKINLLETVGGPGRIYISPGNVVLFEHLHGPAEVRAAGRHFVSRFERIAAIVPLDEQQSEIQRMTALTKDGIQVEVRNVRYRFRLHPGRRYTGPAGRAQEDPYPFSKKAVLNMAYNRLVRADGYQTWEQALDFQVDTAITDYIQKNKIDQLITPGLIGGSDTQKILREAVYSAATRKAFRDRGAELLFCDIGNFEIVPKEVYQQRLESWRSRWAAKADTARAAAEAQRLAAQETGRAQAQAEMLMSIARALQEIGLEGNSRKHLRNIILMQTAQILQTLTDQNRQKPPGEAAGEAPKTAK